jgi:hypothetical protein
LFTGVPGLQRIDTVTSVELRGWIVIGGGGTAKENGDASFGGLFWDAHSNVPAIVSCRKEEFNRRLNSATSPAVMVSGILIGSIVTDPAKTVAFIGTSSNTVFPPFWD